MIYKIAAPKRRIAEGTPQPTSKIESFGYLWRSDGHI
jgi:hypothetical protein